MRSHLNHFALIEHKDQIRDHHRLDAVRDDEGRAVLHQRVERFADLRLCFQVHGGGRVVEDQDTRILQQRARDGHTLLLSARKRHAFFADQRVVAVGEGQDHIMDGGGFRGALDLVLRHVAANAVGDVLADRAAEQERFLLHDANLLTEVGARIILQLHAVEQDAPACIFMETRQ